MRQRVAIIEVDVLVELSVEVSPRLSVAQGAELAETIPHVVSTEVPGVGDVIVELYDGPIERVHPHISCSSGTDFMRPPETDFVTAQSCHDQTWNASQTSND